MYLEQLITGKRFKHLEFDGYSVGICFVDGGAFAAHTRVSCTLAAGEDDLVTGCTFTDTKAEIRLGSKSVIEISMDEEDLLGPEFYEFVDADGTWIVEN